LSLNVRESQEDRSDLAGLSIGLGVMATWLLWVAFLAYQLLHA
jgi:hypothetical protein